LRRRWYLNQNLWSHSMCLGCIFFPCYYPYDLFLAPKRTELVVVSTFLLCISQNGQDHPRGSRKMHRLCFFKWETTSWTMFMWDILFNFRGRSAGGFIFLGEFPFLFRLLSDNSLKSPSSNSSVAADSSISYNKTYYFLILSCILNMIHHIYSLGLFLGP
jgi:hypothetical protein